MQNLFDSAQFLLDKGAFINEPIQVGKDKEPVYFYLMKNNPSLVFSPMFITLIERADLKLIKRFRYSPKKALTMIDTKVYYQLLQYELSSL